MKKYWLAFNIYLQKHLTYRVRVIIWGINDSIYFVIYPFIWLAIYGSRTDIGGFSKSDIVTYYIIIAFISVAINSHVGNRIKADIKDGRINGYLLKPMNYLFFSSMDELAYKFLSFLFISVILACIYIFSADYFLFPKNLTSLGLFILSLIVSFLISHLTQTIVGLSSFWYLETGAFEHTRYILEAVFSGALAPLTFYPLFLQKIADFLPFKFLSFVPAQIYLNRIDFNDSLCVLLGSLVWIFILLIIIIQMWNKGIKKYEGVGI